MMGGVGSSGVKGHKGGSGRPRKMTVSDKQVNALVKAFNKMAKERGKDWAMLVAEWAYDDREETVRAKGKTWTKPVIDVRDRMRAIEIFCNYVITRKTETTIENKKINIVEMPALQDDPAKKLIEDKKVEPMSLGFIQ